MWICKGPSQVITNTPARQKALYEAEIEKLNKGIKEAEDEIRGYADSRKDLELVSDYFRTRAESMRFWVPCPSHREHLS